MRFELAAATKFPTPLQVPCRAEGGKPLAEAFLEEAVRAANEDLWGTLSCTMLVHPETGGRGRSCFDFFG